MIPTKNTNVNWKQKFNPDWIREKITRDTIEFVDKFGYYLRENYLSSSQLRNIFGELKMLQMKLNGLKPDEDQELKGLQTKFLLLLPKLSYSSGRLRNKGLNEFKKIFEEAHKAVGNELSLLEFKKRYNNFVDFIEAILAYHKYYGGK